MFKRLIASLLCLTFSLSNLQYVQAQDFSVNQLPVPGTMIGESLPFSPLALKGLIVNPKKPLEFQFIVDTGDSSVIPAKAGIHNQEQIKQQANQLVKYFLAGLTIPEGDLWVNLSPYEKNRMVPEALGQTDLGRDLLAQDYILKQLTASLIYPEKDLGKEFWSRVYAKAQAQFGTTNIPVNTFNKVWILPDQAQVYENLNAAYVTKATLKVMLDEDYLALSHHVIPSSSNVIPAKAGIQNTDNTHSIASQIVREIVIPEITKEVNTGKNFAPLRQIYQALILAKWYKETIQNGLLDALYTNKNKVAGVNLNDPTVKEQIYNRYLQAYKKGVFNYIKEDFPPLDGEGKGGVSVPRKYFSGGALFKIKHLDKAPNNTAMLAKGWVAGFLLAVTLALSSVQASAQSILPPQIPSVQSQMPPLVSMAAETPTQGQPDRDAAMLIPFTVKWYVKRLENNDTSVRKTAMDTIDKKVFDFKEKLPILFDALRNSYPDVRLWAKQKIAVLKEEIANGWEWENDATIDSSGNTTSNGDGYWVNKVTGESSDKRYASDTGTTPTSEYSTMINQHISQNGAPEDPAMLDWISDHREGIAISVVGITLAFGISPFINLAWVLLQDRKDSIRQRIKEREEREKAKIEIQAFLNNHNIVSIVALLKGHDNPVYLGALEDLGYEVTRSPVGYLEPYRSFDYDTHKEVETGGGSTGGEIIGIQKISKQHDAAMSQIPQPPNKDAAMNSYENRIRSQLEQVSRDGLIPASVVGKQAFSSSDNEKSNFVAGVILNPYFTGARKPVDYTESDTWGSQKEDVLQVKVGSNIENVPVHNIKDENKTLEDAWLEHILYDDISYSLFPVVQERAHSRFNYDGISSKFMASALFVVPLNDIQEYKLQDNEIQAMNIGDYGRSATGITGEIDVPNRIRLSKNHFVIVPRRFASIAHKIFDKEDSPRVIEVNTIRHKGALVEEIGTYPDYESTIKKIIVDHPGVQFFAHIMRFPTKKEFVAEQMKQSEGRNNPAMIATAEELTRSLKESGIITPSVDDNFVFIVNTVRNRNPNVNLKSFYQIYRKVFEENVNAFKHSDGILIFRDEESSSRSQDEGDRYDQKVENTPFLNFLKERMGITDVYLREESWFSYYETSSGLFHGVNQFYRSSYVTSPGFDALLKFCFFADKNDLVKVLLGRPENARTSIEEYRVLVDSQIRFLGIGATGSDGNKQRGFFYLDRLGLRYPHGVVIPKELVEKIFELPREDQRIIISLISEEWPLSNKRVSVRSNPRQSMPGILATKTDVAGDGLLDALEFVRGSWYTTKASEYRRIKGIPEAYDLPIIIQEWVSGYKEPDYEKKRADNPSLPFYGAGVFSTRNPNTNEEGLFGQFLENAKGEELMTGGKKGEDINKLAHVAPHIYQVLLDAKAKLEAEVGPQEVEFVVSNNELYFTQARRINFSPQAEIAYIKQRLEAGKITEATAIPILEGVQKKLGQRRLYNIKQKEDVPVLAKAEASTPGAMQGLVVWNIDKAREFMSRGSPVVFVAHKGNQNQILDIIFNYPRAGLITNYGNSSSHEADLTRLAGIPSLINLHASRWVLSGDGQGIILTNGEKLQEGQEVIIDGDNNRLVAAKDDILKESGVMMDESYGVNIPEERKKVLAPYVNENGHIKSEIALDQFEKLDQDADEEFKRLNFGPDKKAAFMANLKKHFLHDLLIEKQQEVNANPGVNLFPGVNSVNKLGYVSVYRKFYERGHSSYDGLDISDKIALRNEVEARARFLKEEIFKGTGVEVLNDSSYSTSWENDDSGRTHYQQTYHATLDLIVFNNEDYKKVKDFLSKHDLAMLQRTPHQDKAALAKGGIDFNQINVNRTGKTVNVQFDPAQLIALQQGGFQGFTPVIINITRIQSPFQLLGIKTSSQELLAKV